jgi:hypothetical protein
MQGFTFHSYTPPWFSPNGGTPNIYNTCANISSGVSVPSPSTYEYQWPRTGNGYASFAWCYSSNCEFLSVKLNNKLIAGKNYCVSFFVNPFYYCYFLIDKIGAYISTDSIQYSSYGYLNYIPQIENTSGNVITDTLNWTEISGQFTAIGGEQYINIGVFRPDSLVQFVYVDSTVVGFCPFYYLDDVSVYLCDDTLGVNEIEGIKSYGNIYPNPAKDEAYFNYQLKEGQKGIIFIYSITGQVLYEKALNSDNSKLIISTSNLNSGLYFYKVIVDEAIIANEKLMIIK